MPYKVNYIELAPCPFCESDDLTVQRIGMGRGYVRCNNCQAYGPDEEVIGELWNSVERKNKNGK